MGVDLAPGRISPEVALKAVAVVADRWDVPRGRRHLLLGVSESTANHWFSQIARGEFRKDREVKASVLERASHLVSIYDGLHRLIGGVTDHHDAADAWIGEPNRAFGGRKPIDLLLSGRIDDLFAVRSYVDRAVQQ
jgi:Protein of unknown function (DUF2384)